MTRWLVLLSGLLACSVMLNLYWWQVLVDTQLQPLNTITDSNSAAGGSKQPQVGDTPQPTDIKAGQSASLAEQCRNWLRSGQYSRARFAIQQHLQRFPDDIEFLLLEGELVAQTAPVQDILANDYQLLDYRLSDTQRAALLARIERLSHYHITLLSNLKAWDVLAALVEPLWQFEPDNRNYRLALGLAYAQQGMSSLVEYVLGGMPPDDPEVMQRFAILANSLNTLPAEAPAAAPPSSHQYARSMPLERHGDHFLVDVLIANQPVNLLLDTGASTTALSQRQFERLRNVAQAILLGEYAINTAGGRIQAPIYRVNQLTLLDTQFSDVALVILPDHVLPGSDGLLGMNVLQALDFKLDQSTNQLLFSAR